MEKILEDFNSLLQSPIIVAKPPPAQSPVEATLPPLLPSLPGSTCDAEALPTTQSDLPQPSPQEDDESEQLTPDEMRQRILICTDDIDQLEEELKELNEKGQRSINDIESPLLTPICHAEAVQTLAGSLVGNQTAVTAMLEAAKKSIVEAADQAYHNQNLTLLGDLSARVDRLSAEMGAEMKISSRRCLIEQQIMKMKAGMAEFIKKTPGAEELWAEYQQMQAEKRAEEAARAEQEKIEAERMLLAAVPGRKTKKAAKKGANRRNDAPISC